VDRPRREKKLATPELLAAAAGGSDGFIFAAKRARRREMKLARLVACAAVAVAATAEEFGTGPARLARCGGPCPGDFLGESLNYLRIAKSGSSSVVLQLRWMNGTNPKCHGLRMNRHETLARHMPPGSANFAVLREPCERFVSMYDHLRYNRRNERILRQKDAMTWAILLRDDPEEREFWLNTFKRVEDDEVCAPRRDASPPRRRAGWETHRRRGDRVDGRDSSRAGHFVAADRVRRKRHDDRVPADAPRGRAGNPRPCAPGMRAASRRDSEPSEAAALRPAPARRAAAENEREARAHGQAEPGAVLRRE